MLTLRLCCVQGLGLLINLVEYSARNKYCLMEMVMEEGPVPGDATVLSPPNGDGDGDGSSGPLSAIAACLFHTQPVFSFLFPHTENQCHREK